MSVDVKNIEQFHLGKFAKDINRIESQEQDLIYDRTFSRVCDRLIYNKSRYMIEWKCAICGKQIMIDTNRTDVENFVCSECKKVHNNENIVIDKRILDSRNELFNRRVKGIYDELDHNLGGSE